MKTPKKKCEFTNQELEDLWSALGVWQRNLDKKQNPQTDKDITKLIKKVRKYLGHKKIT
jgi:hypothetical protein